MDNSEIRHYLLIGIRLLAKSGANAIEFRTTAERDAAFDAILNGEYVIAGGGVKSVEGVEFLVRD